jgi:hypothetical protein
LQFVPSPSADHRDATAMHTALLFGMAIRSAVALGLKARPAARYGATLLSAPTWLNFGPAACHH